MAASSVVDKNTPLVIVKPKAYLKMLKHVLRFGSMAKNKSQFKECMGMLFGKLGEQKGTVRDVIVTDVAEFTHGGHIEVAFEDKDYISFAEINDKFAAQGDGIFNIGWYHSHPGLTCFLSTVDVRNHLGFQTTNPSAIAIVWDHIRLEEEGDIGFETFRLTEIGKGQYSDYKSVETIAEPPADLSFYKSAIKEIFDLQQGGNPPMFEIGEVPSVVGDFQPKPILDEKFKSPEYVLGTEMLNDAHISKIAVSKGLIEPISDYLNKWGKSIEQKLKNKGVMMNQNLNSLTDMIENKINSLQKWFMAQSNEIFMDVWEKVDTPLEDQINILYPHLKAVQESIVIPESMKILLDLEIPDLITKLNEKKAQFDELFSKIHPIEGGN